MKKAQPPKPKSDEEIIEFVRGLSDEQVRQFIGRIITGKKPKGKIDLLCWQCKNSMNNSCPHTKSGKAPKNGVVVCHEWETSTTVEYGNSPAKQRAQDALLGKRQPKKTK